VATGTGTLHVGRIYSLWVWAIKKLILCALESVVFILNHKVKALNSCMWLGNGKVWEYLSCY